MILIKNINVISKGKVITRNVVIKESYIDKVRKSHLDADNYTFAKIIDGTGKILIPGVIDTHVHFREPGFTHKADIESESKAAVAGGVTSFIEMPNTNPATNSLINIEEKLETAKLKSVANYAFYIGGGENTISEINKDNANKIPGIKLFMGSSTAGKAISDANIINNIFNQKKYRVTVHCEDDALIKINEEKYKAQYGQNIPIKYHEHIRSEDACYASTKFAIETARKLQTKLHIAHVSTAKELELFDSEPDISKKQITSEVCVHHLWFSSIDYDKLGAKIKCNPSIKTGNDKKQLLKAVINDKIDVISTDHAPHTIEEKNNSYFKAPSGIPMIQHSLLLMLELYHQKKITLEKIIEKMCHNPAKLFNIEKRGYIKEGYFADLVIIDLNNENKVTNNTLLYKCKWSPIENYILKSKITHTFVNGNIVYENEKINSKFKGKQLIFKL